MQIRQTRGTVVHHVHYALVVGHTLTLLGITILQSLFGSCCPHSGASEFQEGHA